MLHFKIGIFYWSCLKKYFYVCILGFFVHGFPKLLRFQEHHEKILNKFLSKLKQHLVCRRDIDLNLPTSRIKLEPWLVWLSGLSAGLQTERLLVWFPVRAHARVAEDRSLVGSVQEATDRCFSHHCFSPSLPLSFPPSLKISEQNLKKKKKRIKLE